MAGVKLFFFLGGGDIYLSRNLLINYIIMAKLFINSIY